MTSARPAPRREPHDQVRAAGTVLWRRPPGRGVEIALVHRPRYDDWSLPKGKLKRGEDFAAAARRETREETGMECVLGAELTTIRYCVEGRPKVVRYWAAEAVGGDFTPSREVDRIAWLPLATARIRLTHDRDRPVLDAAPPLAPADTADPADPLGPQDRGSRSGRSDQSGRSGQSGHDSRNP